MRRRWFVLLTLVAFGLVLGVGAFLWHSVQTSSVVSVQTQIDQAKPVLAAIRILVIGLVALAWPALTRALRRLGHLDEAGAARLASLRWRIVTWLLLIELLLGQNLLGRFLAAGQGAGA